MGRNVSGIKRRRRRMHSSRSMASTKSWENSKTRRKALGLGVSIRLGTQVGASVSVIIGIEQNICIGVCVGD